MPLFNKKATKARVIQLEKEMSMPGIPKSIYSNPFSEVYNRISFVRSHPIPNLFKKKDVIKLALISLPKISDVRPKKYTSQINNSLQGADKDACNRFLNYYPKKSAQKLLSAYKNSIKHATEFLHADIICLNEHGMPNPIHQQEWNEAVSFSRSYANKHKCLIIAGTIHDYRTLYNTSYIFYPKCKKFGEKYHKQVCAQQKEIPNKELVNVPAKRGALCLKLFGINVALLICLDIADFSTVAPLIENSEQINMLIVPTYAKTMGHLQKLSKIISESICGGVALVNSYNEGKASSSLYMHGDEITEDHPELERISLGDEKGEISIFKIDAKDLRNKKLSADHSMNEELRWLFGAEVVVPLIPN